MSIVLFLNLQTVHNVTVLDLFGTGSLMKRAAELLPNSLLDFVLLNDADLFLKNIFKEL